MTPAILGAMHASPGVLGEYLILFLALGGLLWAGVSWWRHRND